MWLRLTEMKSKQTRNEKKTPVSIKGVLATAATLTLHSAAIHTEFD